MLAQAHRALGDALVTLCFRPHQTRKALFEGPLRREARLPFFLVKTRASQLARAILLKATTIGRICVQAIEKLNVLGALALILELWIDLVSKLLRQRSNLLREIFQASFETQQLSASAALLSTAVRQRSHFKLGLFVLEGDGFEACVLGRCVKRCHEWTQRRGDQVALCH